MALADLLLHVVDISHPDHPSQIDAVNKTLADIHAARHACRRNNRQRTNTCQPLRFHRPRCSCLPEDDNAAGGAVVDADVVDEQDVLILFQDAALRGKLMYAEA